MSLGTIKEPSIQMTLFDYFMDSDQFTFNEAVYAVKQVKEVKRPSIRARVYEGIEKGLFERVDKGIYRVSRTDSNGKENTCLLINGDGRNLSFIEDNSIDAIITDHPYNLTKSLNGGNRAFAEYDRFKYTNEDFKAKARILRPGCFLVEFLPEESAENYDYLYSIKQFAKENGLEYYAKVTWKKGDFVAYTGRKAKNSEDIMFFTKGKCRELRLDAKKNKAMIKSLSVVQFKESWNDIGVEEEDQEVIDLNLIVDKDKQKEVEIELDKAFDNWMNCECRDSILIDDDLDYSELCQVPICEYMLMWLEKKDYDYIDITDIDKTIDFNTISENVFIERITDILKRVAPEKLYYMSGTNGMLPTVFDVQPPSKKERVHQAEKPVELLKQIINFTTLPNEKLLDQFAGSFNLGEAALEMGRDSITVEINEEFFNNAVSRIKRKLSR